MGFVHTVLAGVLGKFALILALFPVLLVYFLVRLLGEKGEASALPASISPKSGDDKASGIEKTGD